MIIIMILLYDNTGMVPLWFATLGHLLYEDTTIKIPFQNILYSLAGLVTAIGIGQLVKRYRPVWAQRMVKVSKGIMVLSLIFVLTVGIYANLYIFKLMTVEVICLVLFIFI